MKPHIHAPDIVIVGGSTDEISQLLTCIPQPYTTDTIPLDSHFGERNYRPPPELVFLIPDTAPDLALELLRHIREKLPGCAVILAASNPAKEYIIQAFRLGAADFLIFPLRPDAFWATFPDRIRASPSDSLLLWPRWENRPGHGFEWAIPKPDLRRPHHEVEVQLLGPLKIAIRGTLLPNLPGEKVNALLGYFLYHHRKPIHREKLLSKFWGYTDNASARNSLNVATHTIRRHLQSSFPENDFLLYDDGNYYIQPELDILTDTDAFLFYWKEGRRLEKQDGLDQALAHYQSAALIYQGDFLEDIHYEEWCELERDNLQEKYLHVLDRMGAYYLLQKDYAMAAGIFKKMLAKDRCLEAVHRNLILCYYQHGERDKAIKQYFKCEEALRRELQVEPSHPTRELLRLIKTERKLPDLLR